jgi:nucleotide-binding universal stress UspA family protein
MGFSLAKAMGADIILLHVIADSVYYSSTEYSPIMGFSDYMGVSQLQLDNLDGLRKAAQHFLDKSKHHLGDESIQTMVEEGDFAESILKTAKSTHTDVIVIGSHSQKWLEKIVMGSVTEKVLNHTTIPLFVVPTKKQ